MKGQTSLSTTCAKKEGSNKRGAATSSLVFIPNIETPSGLQLLVKRIIKIGDKGKRV